MVEEEERKTGSGGFLAQEEDEQSLLVEILPGWHLEAKADET